MHMNVKNNQFKKLSVLEYSCPDLDCPYDSKDMRVCQYCFHIPEDQVAKLKPQDWVCDLPNREAQRRHHAGLTDAQKVLT